MNTYRQLLLRPERLWTRPEVLSRPGPVPKEAGIYAWYFRKIPPGVPTTGCVRKGEHTLLYLGISPRRPPSNGKLPSQQQLANRVRYHFSGNAEGSTLRLSLGCLLGERLGIELRRVGSGTRMTFGLGEDRLSTWMAENASVTWMTHPEPWELEKQLIGELSLPLNLDQNTRHPFYPVLSNARRTAKSRARALPIVGGP